MFKKIFIFVSILFAATSLYAEDLAGFNKLLDDHNMRFIMPKDFSPVPVVENEDVIYQYAIKSKKVKLELRYSIFSLKEHIREYEEFKKKKNGVMIDPNSPPAYYAMTIAVVMNIAGTEKYNETKLAPEAVKTEFNADWGASYIVECKSGYSKGYKYATILALHRDNEADVYMVFLFDDLKTVMAEMLASFYSIKFK